jgi:uncharacterized FlaG/YvyC family protein
MSEQALKSVASGTGTFAVLGDRFHNAQGGKRSTVSGKSLPVANVEQDQETGPDLERLARQLNLASRSIGREIRFRVDLENGHSVIQVLDRETGEIIRQIPGDEAAGSLSNPAGSGIRLFDELV